MSSRPFFLLPLCFVSALALNAYAALDPTGVYQDYLEKLDAATPPVAAMPTAAADGVYPWSEPKAPEPPPVSDPAPLPDPEPEPEPEEPDSPFTTVDASYFDDALFIGDSHTDGFKDYAGLNNADYLCHNGLTVWSAVEKAEFPGKQTLAQALSGKHYGKIYLMLGINELGNDLDDIAAKFSALIDAVRAAQPNAIVYVEANLHVGPSRSSTDATFNNPRIDRLNEKLAALADGKDIFYIDINEVFDDENGNLRADASGDSTHVYAKYDLDWCDWLCTKAIVR